MKKVKFVLSVLFILFFSSFTFANVINVPADQPTIQEGINVAVDGDTVLVQSGTWIENINYNGKNITVGSLFLTTQDTTYISQTVIDGNHSGSVVKFNSGEDSTAVLTGFTITNGYSNYGGGIRCSNSSPKFKNVIITNNSANDGSGIYCYESSPSLMNITIKDNSAYDRGGGILCYGSSPSLSNVTITGNSAGNSGGGISFIGSNPIFNAISRCNIFLNYAFENGNDLFSYSNINVIVDTFTVFQPDDYFAYPIDNFTFDILHSKVEQVNQDLYVSPIGSDDNSGLTQDAPLLTISYALVKIIPDSIDTHTINLANGTYSPSQTGERFPLNCRSFVSINGVNEEFTILDGDSLSSVLYCYNDNYFSIDDMTIQNGYSDDSGGGIYCHESSPSLINVTIISNCADDGGGIYCYGSNPCLENVTIKDNSTEGYGGGMYCSESSPSLVNITITGNSAYMHGGGIHCNYNSSPSLENVEITDNIAYSGGGIYCYNSSPNLVKVNITNNNVDNRGGGICCDDSSPSLEDVTITDNSASGQHYFSYGGGIYCSGSSPSLVNVTITGNSAIGNSKLGYGGGIYCSGSSPSLINVTIVDNYSSDYGGGIYYHHSPNSILKNVTITDNSADDGGGIYCEESNPILENVTILDNTAS